MFIQGVGSFLFRFSIHGCGKTCQVIFIPQCELNRSCFCVTLLFFLNLIYGLNNVFSAHFFNVKVRFPEKLGLINRHFFDSSVLSSANNDQKSIIL